MAQGMAVSPFLVEITPVSAVSGALTLLQAPSVNHAQKDLQAGLIIILKYGVETKFDSFQSSSNYAISIRT